MNIHYHQHPCIRIVLGLGILLAGGLALPSAAHAQVFELNGGNSSLYEAGGGSISMHTPGSNTTIGAGMIGGHFSYGAHMEKLIGKNLFSAGDEQIDFLLPTDIFDPSHYLYARGLGLKTNLGGTDLFTFAGTTSTLYETPIFEGARSGPPMGFISVRKSIGRDWQLSSDTLISDKLTQIVATQWKPARKFLLAAAGGAGAGQPYGAASINFSRKYLDAMGSYVSAGSNFRRVVVSSPIQAEPNKGNLLLTLKPFSFVTLSGGTQSFLVPNLATNTNESSSVRSASASMLLGGAILSGTVYDSSALGQSNHAAAFTASREATHWFRIMSNYMVSKPMDTPGTSSFFTTVTENLNQHLSVNENISTSNGQTSLLYGGSLLTNFLTVSANYENFYVPVRTSAPFQQSLVLDVSIHLFGRATLHGATFVGPTGQTLYTATANAVAVRGQANLPAGESQPSIGGSVLRVQVLDTDNHPIEGAALLVDSKPVFTGPDGSFALRERKPRQHTLKVLTDQFLDGGSWEVKSKPELVWSSAQDDDPAAVVVVRRIFAERPTQGQPDLSTRLEPAGNH